MIGHFRLGFANRTLGYRLPDKNRKSRRGNARAACRSSASCARSGHEHFNGSVVIPGVRPRRPDDRRCTAARSRQVCAQGTPLHLYLPGPHRGVWNELALQVSKEIILCESIIDALTFWCAGYPQRDRELRRERLHRRSSGRVPEARRQAGAGSPTTATKPERRRRCRLLKS